MSSTNPLCALYKKAKLVRISVCTDEYLENMVNRDPNEISEEISEEI